MNTVNSNNAVIELLKVLSDKLKKTISDNNLITDFPNGSRVGIF